MRPNRHATFRLLATGALLALLAACQTTPGGPGPASDIRAERLLRQGNLAEAARMYEQLAQDNPPPLRDQYALSAARAWLDANRADDAQRALELTTPALPGAQGFERELLLAETGVARGQYQAAWQRLSQVAEPARPEDAARLFYLRQQVALRAGRTSDAVQAGIARERVATDDTSRTRARRDLLVDLRGAIERGLRVDPAASRDSMERGWIEIAQIATEAGRSPLGVSARVDRWRQRFPGHPASTIVMSEILDPAARPGMAAGRTAAITGPVALLLPLSAPGSLGASATLVRDGFQAAVARLPDAGLSDLRLYDTATMPVGAAMQRAVAEGATFIVGPLTKEEAQVAVRERPLHVPVLLLNTLPGEGGGGDTWQYGLAPEDEARQIARQIAGSGGRNAVVLVPSDDWGQRVAAAFADELRQAGGNVLAEGRYSYDSARNDIRSTVENVLGIVAAQARRDRVQQAIGTSVESVERPRPDIHAIFAAGHQSLALRQINPLLSFLYAGDIPTYISSDGVSDSAAANRDLGGTRVLDMPWVLDTVGTASDARLSTEGAWSSRGGPRASRLFAFGYDAARIAAELRRGLASWPLDGVTGRLSLTPEGRIERQLNWARIQRDGTVQAADPLSP